MSGFGARSALGIFLLAVIFIFWLSATHLNESQNLKTKSDISIGVGLETLCKRYSQECPACLPSSSSSSSSSSSENSLLATPDPCPRPTPCPTCPPPAPRATDASLPCPEEALKLERYQMKVEQLAAGIMMDREEVTNIISFLKPNDTFIEWGSGGSTTVFSQFVSEYYSIEHNEEWCNTVKKNTQRANLKNIHYFCFDIKPGHKGWKGGFKEGTYQQFQEYVDVIETLPPKKYDVALVDGRARISCALRLLPFLKEESVVFVHDVFFSRDYRIILEFYDPISVVFSTRGLIALKPKQVKKVVVNEECEYSPSCEVVYEDGSKTSKTGFHGGAGFFLGFVDHP